MIIENIQVTEQNPEGMIYSTPSELLIIVKSFFYNHHTPSGLIKIQLRNF